jgi:hypothetical protein
MEDSRAFKAERQQLPGREILRHADVCFVSGGDQRSRQVYDVACPQLFDV